MSEETLVNLALGRNLGMSCWICILEDVRKIFESWLHRRILRVTTTEALFDRQ